MGLCATMNVFWTGESELAKFSILHHPRSLHARTSRTEPSSTCVHGPASTMKRSVNATYDAIEAMARAWLLASRCGRWCDAVAGYVTSAGAVPHR